MTSERIEELAQAVAYFANECCGRKDGYEQDVAKQAADAIRTAVREALEEAGGVCETYITAKACAAAVRALIPAPPP